MAVRPALFRKDTRSLDAALCACLAAALLQLVPLPAWLRITVSPALVSVDRALRLDMPADPAAGPPAPLSVDPASGVEAFILAAAAILMFWSARHVYGAGGARRTVRALAACGLVLSAVALIQHSVAPHLLYGIWRPASRNAQSPFGPFVNRNDLAAWLVMALPLTMGYFFARLETRRRNGRPGVEALLEGSGAWLAVAICLMAATLVSTTSRSGVMGGLAGAAAIVLLTRLRVERRSRAWLLAGLSLVVLVAAAYANVGALATRVGETLDSGVGGRREIWRTTALVIRDFWATGVGVGAFERVMSVYQPPHVFSFNHAHDEYLQLVAEGGVLVAIPVIFAVGSGILAIGRHLRADRSPLFWVRAGAASGIVAVAVQSVWETGLRMPANGVLFALCAALVLHEPGAPHGMNGAE